MEGEERQNPLLGPQVWLWMLLDLHKRGQIQPPATTILEIKLLTKEQLKNLLEVTVPATLRTKEVWIRTGI